MGWEAVGVTIEIGINNIIPQGPIVKIVPIGGRNGYHSLLERPERLRL